MLQLVSCMGGASRERFECAHPSSTLYILKGLLIYLKFINLEVSYEKFAHFVPFRWYPSQVLSVSENTVKIVVSVFGFLEI